MRAALTALLIFFACAANAQAPREAALIAAAGAGDSALVARLLREGADIDARDVDGATALLAATRSNRVAAARLLIRAGADVNAADKLMDSAYLLAGARGHTEILKLTLGAGADLTSTNRFGGTALTPACHYGHVDTVRVLLATRVDIDQVNPLGWTCLLEAVILGDGGPRHVQIVRMVVAAGARIDLADRQGVTPLAHARRRGKAQIVEILRAAGAR